MQPACSSGSWSGSSRQLKPLLSPFRNRIYRQLRKKLIVDFFSVAIFAWWMPLPSNRSPRVPVDQGKDREYWKFNGVATTCPRTNTQNFRRLSAKFPVRIEPGILYHRTGNSFRRPGIFKCENGKSAPRALTSCLFPAGNRTSPAMHGPCLLEETGGYCQGNRNADSRITDNIKRWRRVTIAMMS